MARELIFRAWHKKKKYMYKNIAVGVSNKIGYKMGSDRKYSYEDAKNVVVMQYTGSKDKSGKRIYEGDILKITVGKKPMIVHWNKKRLRYFIKSADGKIIKEFGSWPSKLSVRIIGNIYENPELI